MLRRGTDIQLVDADTRIMRDEGANANCKLKECDSLLLAVGNYL